MNGIPEKKKICVIGAGPSGLAAIRQCMDEDLDVVCFERSCEVGGLWYYRDGVKEGVASVARSTIINTSKEYSGYSDFPPPLHFPNYMHNSYMLKYFQMYAEANGLERFIRFNTKVLNVTFAEDYNATGRWKVTVEDTENGQQTSEIFDGVMICTGHHVVPLSPNFPGQERFKGNIRHTHTYKHPHGYEGKQVLVVGVGNSGADAAAELSLVAKQLYLSTRRGCWIRGRVCHRGYPIDSYMATRAFGLFFSIFPESWMNYAYETYVNSWMDHELFGLKPKHRIFNQHPTINDAFPNAILAGRIAVRPDIKEFTENGVIFSGESKETLIDEVILATGYQMTLPFIDPSIIAPSTNEVYLFKNMFQPDLRHPHTLALIGLVQPTGPIHTAAELQARWFAGLQTGRLKLPSKQEMKKIIEQDKQFVREHFYPSPRHSLEVLYSPYMDSIASYVGCKPNLFKYAITDPKLFYHLIFGLFTVYQYRLEGKHSWKGARDAVISTNDRIRAALQLKYPELPNPRRTENDVAMKQVTENGYYQDAALE